MSDFATSPGGSAPLDPDKRVAYPLGMVLGAEDFEQEQFHLRSRDDRSVRALHGYGTVAGLAVTWSDGMLEVAPGLAVDPEGRLVCVPARQCADLAAWLTAHRDELVASLPDSSPPDAIRLHVVLCHQECATDAVPLPSETCRSATDSAAPSRILDSFELRLTLDEPVAAGEVAAGGLGAAVDQLLALLDASAGSPPDAVDLDALRRELTGWVTDTRPEVPDNSCLDGPAPNCAADPASASSGVLLARIEVDLTETIDGGVAAAGPPHIEDRGRPVLLSSRFLQEWLLRLTVRRDDDDHNLLRNLDTGDVHTQYLPADGSRPMTGTLDAGGNRVVGLADSGSDPSAALRRDQILGGDLAPNPPVRPGARLSRIQGTRLTASGGDAPTAGQFLGFDGTRWLPRDLPERPAPGPGIGQLLPFVTIHYTGSLSRFHSTFLLWFNLAAVDGAVRVGEVEPGGNLIVLAERCEGEAVTLDEVDVENLERVNCNAFRLDLVRDDPPDPLLRFVFVLPEMRVDLSAQGGDDDVDLLEYAEDQRITWDGWDGRETVTKFVVAPIPARPMEGFEEVELFTTPNGGSRLVFE